MAFIGNWRQQPLKLLGKSHHYRTEGFKGEPSIVPHYAERLAFLGIIGTQLRAPVLVENFQSGLLERERDGAPWKFRHFLYSKLLGAVMRLFTGGFPGGTFFVFSEDDGILNTLRVIWNLTQIRLYLQFCTTVFVNQTEKPVLLFQKNLENGKYNLISVWFNKILQNYFSLV